MIEEPLKGRGILALPTITTSDGEIQMQSSEQLWHTAAFPANVMTILGATAEKFNSSATQVPSLLATKFEQLATNMLTMLGKSMTTRLLYLLFFRINPRV